jgi:hypothetical protein
VEQGEEEKIANHEGGENTVGTAQRLDRTAGGTDPIDVVEDKYRNQQRPQKRDAEETGPDWNAHVDPPPVVVVPATG